MSLPDLYRDQLLNLQNGYPLYEPDPGDEAYVRVGDVGYIDCSSGHFYRLFNAFFDDSSPINSSNGVPEHFDPLPDELKGIYQGGPLPIGAHSSKTVSSLHVNFDVQGSVIPVGASIRLSCSSERGAALILKEPAQRIDSKKTKKLGAELLKNYKTWHAFLCKTFGDDIRLREMVFVTGCDLSSDWATLTFLQKGMNGELRFGVCDPQSVSVTPVLGGHWQTTTSVPIRYGPSAEQKRSHIEGEPGNNQCIFVRGWRVSERRVRALPKLKAAAELKDDEPETDDDEMTERTMAVSFSRIEEDILEESPQKQHYGNKRVYDSYGAYTVYDEAFEKLDDTHGTDDVVLLHDDDIVKLQAIKNQIVNSETPDPMTWICDGLQLTCNSNGTSVESKDPDYPHSSPYSRTMLSGTPENLQPSYRYICSGCGKRFSRPSSLRTHELIHSGDAPFECTYAKCGRRFRVQSNMHRHITRVHERPASSKQDGSSEDE